MSKGNKHLMKQVESLTKQVESLTKQIGPLTKKVKELTAEVSYWTEHSDTLTDRIVELQEEAVGLKKKEMDSELLIKDMKNDENKYEKKFKRLMGIVNTLFPAAVESCTTKPGSKKAKGTTSPRYDIS